MIKVFEAFAGIGTQRMALRNLGIEHEVVAIAEIDKFAIKSYEAIHGEVNNLGDISEINVEDIPDHDLFTYSFPCQDISVAGNLKGLKKDGGTRSGLLWECERIIETKKPKYLLMENVKNLVGKRFKADFDKWLERLEELGYTNYWKVINAKDYGVPQNRERVFCVSILGEHKPYVFPEPIELELKLKDMLEDEVDEKYYLNNEKAEQLIATITKENNITKPTVVDATINEPKTKEIMNAITARYDAGVQNYKSIGGAVIEPERILGIFDKENQTHQAGSVYNKDKIAPTLDTMQGGWRQPSVLIKNGTKKGYLEATDGDGVDLAFLSSNTRRGRVQKKINQTLDTGSSKGVVVAKEEFGRMGKQAIETLHENNLEHGDTINPFNKKPSSKNGASPTLTTRPEGFKTAINVVDQFRIRKLTPKECWRLMGCTDEDFNKAEKVNSNTQLYKQAGNAIVVNVLEHIFYNLFKVNQR